MKRIIYHWTAGRHTPSQLDLDHYHYVIDGAGKVHLGKFPVVANEAPQQGRYAAHTLNCNTGSIGVAVAAMAGAIERPFDAGSDPITQDQVRALIVLCAKLARDYSIPVTRKTILGHAEVQPTLGIKQRGKWDISWLPGNVRPQDPVMVGDYLRAQISAMVDPKQQPVSPPLAHVNTPKPTLHPAPPKPNWLAAIIRAILAIFRSKK